MPLVHAIRNDELRREIQALEETILALQGMSYTGAFRILRQRFKSDRRERIRALLREEFSQGDLILEEYIQKVLIPVIEQAIRRPHSDEHYILVEIECEEDPPGIPPPHLRTAGYTLESVVLSDLAEQGKRSVYYTCNDTRDAREANSNDAADAKEHNSDLIVAVTNELLAVDYTTPIYTIRSNMKGKSIARKLISRYHEHIQKPWEIMHPIWDLYRLTVTVNRPRSFRKLHAIHDLLKQSGVSRSAYNNEKAPEEVRRLRQLLGMRTRVTNADLASWTVPSWDGKLFDEKGNPRLRITKRFQYIAEQFHEWYQGIPIEVHLESEVAHVHNQTGYQAHHLHEGRRIADIAQSEAPYLAAKDFLEETNLFNRGLIVRKR